MIKIKQKKRKRKNKEEIRRLMDAAANYFEAGDLNRAAQACREVLEYEPNNFMFLHFLGEICYRLGDFTSAMKHMMKSLEINPVNADAYNNLGVVLKEMGRLEEAIACYRKLLALDRNYPDAYANLGTIYRAKGQIDEAEAYYRKALEIAPGDSVTYSNLLFTMNYNARHDARTLFSEHLNFSRIFETPLVPARGPYHNRPSSDRRIRIGYVSPDFRRHSVNYFLEPVLKSHDHEGFEIFCYSDVRVPDAGTDRLKGYADRWRNITGIPDEKVAGLIKEDGIDILIDLAGHTGYNRMLVFARKPAPVQVSWLGYPNTTGLSAIDYRLVDEYSDPPGLTDPYYTEKLIRLPYGFLCYLPEENSPEVGGLPAIQAGHITFGSFNFFAKLSPEVVMLWAKIMKSVHGSRMLLKAKSLSDGPTREYALQMFVQTGIAPERVGLFSYEPSYRSHLEAYNRVDIALDPFPYNGTTTTCEAIWMGTPVVTLCGSLHASRVGVSILSHTGLRDLIAGTPEEYFSIAVNLANDSDRLRSLRGSLRSVMAASPLTEAGRFTRDLENTYRRIWRKWCEENNSRL